MHCSAVVSEFKVDLFNTYLRWEFCFVIAFDRDLEAFVVSGEASVSILVAYSQAVILPL